MTELLNKKETKLSLEFVVAGYLRHYSGASYLEIVENLSKLATKDQVSHSLDTLNDWGLLKQEYCESCFIYSISERAVPIVEKEIYPIWKTEILPMLMLSIGNKEKNFAEKQVPQEPSPVICLFLSTKQIEKMRNNQAK